MKQSGKQYIESMAAYSYSDRNTITADISIYQYKYDMCLPQISNTKMNKYGHVNVDDSEKPVTGC